MRSFFGFVKSTLIGGLLFLLPLGIIVIVLAKLVTFARRAGDTLHARLFPGAASDFLPTLIAILVLLALAFAAGTLARTRAGLRLFGWLEGTILSRFPAYTLVRQTVSDLSDGSVQLTAGDVTEVVEVRLDDMAVLGFLIERRADGNVVVFLPGAPSALSGSVALVDSERITATTLAPTDVVHAMRRLGAGLAGLQR